MIWHINFWDKQTEAFGGFFTAHTPEERDAMTVDLKAKGLRVIWEEWPKIVAGEGAGSSTVTDAETVRPTIAFKLFVGMLAYRFLLHVELGLLKARKKISVWRDALENDGSADG